MSHSKKISSDALKSIGAMEDWMPKIGRPVSPRVTHIEDGRFLVCLKLTGVPFVVQTDEHLEHLFDNLTEFFSKTGRDLGGRLSYWTVFIRRRVSFERQYQFDSAFMRNFSKKYLQRFKGGQYFENAYYLSLILKYDDFDDGLKEAESLCQQAVSSLAGYDPAVLETFERSHMNGTAMQFSQVYQFIGDLVNASSTIKPVSAEPGFEVIPDSWLHFGYDVMEIRGAEVAPGRRFATCYDLRTFPHQTSWGQLNPLLSVPVEFTIAQSFDCMSGFAANRLIDQTINKLESAGDKAVHQVEELREAQGKVHSGELTFGDYHGTLIVYGTSPKMADANGTLLTSRSNNECRTSWMRAAASAPFTYFSQVPGAKTKPRPKPQSTRNLAAMFSCHDHSTGKSEGNPLGDGSAVIPMETASNVMYHLNYHATRDAEVSVGERAAGHAVFHGTTGVGKTTFQEAMLGFLTRFYPFIFGLDKGRGMEPFIRAIGGTYINLEKNQPTGWAPFSLPDTPINRDFLYTLIELCGKRSGQDSNGNAIKIDLQASEKKQCKDAVDAVMGIDDVMDRRFGLILENIPKEGEDGLHARLANWCYSETDPGRYWWVFDNPPATRLDISGHTKIAFDVEAFLVEDYDPSEPAFAYLFHLKKLMRQSGQLMATIIEEYWLPVRFRTIRDQIEEILASGRKEGEFLVMLTQQPEQAMRDESFFALVRSLTATKIWLPDTAAEYETCQRMGMSHKVFLEYKKLDKHSRMALVMQGNQCAFVKFDLAGFDDELAILSGDKENALLLDEVRAVTGDNPDDWLPVFLERVFAKRLRAKLERRYGKEETLWIDKYTTAMQQKRNELAVLYPDGTDIVTLGHDTIPA